MRIAHLLRRGIGVGSAIMPDLPAARPGGLSRLTTAAVTARRAAEARWLAWPGNLRGALWIVLASILFTVMSAMVKTVGSRLDSFEIGFFRCAFGLLTIVPFMLRVGPDSLRTDRPFLHLWRGLLGTTAMFCGFYSITHLPLADATAIGFASTLFMIVLAVLFLGETVRWRRWTATAVGFLGVLVMVGPGGHGPSPAMAAALFGALCVATVSVVIKKLSQTESPLSILFSFGIVSTAASAGPAILVWQTPTFGELALLVLIGVIGTVAQNCGIRGFRAGEATAVAPFDYSRLVFAGLLGFLLFGDVPSPQTLMGAGLIVASTLYIARREAALARRPEPAETAAPPLPAVRDQAAE
ncbi:MAG: DMT family transporter [Thalassobaculum sp.]